MSASVTTSRPGIGFSSNFATALGTPPGRGKPAAPGGGGAVVNPRVGGDFEAGNRLQLELRRRDVDAARREKTLAEWPRRDACAPARARGSLETRFERRHFV